MKKKELNMLKNRFVKEAKYSLRDIELFISFLYITPVEEKDSLEAIQILKDKISEIEWSDEKSLKDKVFMNRLKEIRF